jgi:hypothetical protein
MMVRPHLSDNGLRITTVGVTINVQIPGLSGWSSSIQEFRRLWKLESYYKSILIGLQI